MPIHPTVVAVIVVGCHVIRVMHTNTITTKAALPVLLQPNCCKQFFQAVAVVVACPIESMSSVEFLRANCLKRLASQVNQAVPIDIINCHDLLQLSACPTP